MSKKVYNISVKKADNAGFIQQGVAAQDSTKKSKSAIILAIEAVETMYPGCEVMSAGFGSTVDIDVPTD